MSADPYHAVQSELQTSLQSAEALSASYRRIRSTATGETEEVVWARNEFKATLAALEADFEDLEESVQIVESTDARFFGLDDAEVAHRRQYVNRVKHEIESMRALVNSNSSSDSRSRTPTPAAAAVATGSQASPAEDDQTAWAHEEQQMMMREQDRTLDTITGTLATLAQQAGLMGQEIEEHNELLDDLESGVDSTDSKLGGAMLKMKKFIRQNEETKSGWCIIILIIILMALLLAVILT